MLSGLTSELAHQKMIKELVVHYRDKLDFWRNHEPCLERDDAIAYCETMLEFLTAKMEVDYD